jgi:hypothetical protein
MTTLRQIELGLEPHDFGRLAKQRKAIFNLMRLGNWYTLAALEEITGYPQASISARLRDFRKAKHGSHTVDRRRLFEASGVWEYRLTLRGPTA